MFSPDVPIRLDYHGKKWVDREHVCILTLLDTKSHSFALP